MAVDYFHRLAVRGPRQAVRAFRHRMHREYERAVAGETWTEIVPFSFAALYELAPSARRVEREIPSDPYELSVWPVKRIDQRHVEVRYQFQTRNLEMAALLQALSRALPSLTFILTTFCLDDSSIDSHRLRSGKTHTWTMPERREAFHWNRARKKFGLVGDDVYEDDTASDWAEQAMLEEAFRRWDRADGPRRGRYSWRNQHVLRDLETERELAVYAVAAARSQVPSRGMRDAPRRPTAPAIVSWEDQALGQDVTWEHVVVLVGKLLRLRARGRSRFLIVARAHPHRFVQFGAGQSPGALRGEAISNYFLAGEVGRLRQLARARKAGRGARSARLPRALQTRGVLLSKADRAALCGLGWQEPTSRTPNFWRTWRRGVDPADVANVAVNTLRDAFGIRSPRGLEVICGSHSPSG